MTSLTVSRHPANNQKDPIPLNTLVSILNINTIKYLYNQHGFYSALNYVIQAGLVDPKDQIAAEKYIEDAVNL